MNHIRLERMKAYIEQQGVVTIKELQAMIQRYQVATLLNENRNYNEITEQTGASSATICRVNKCLQYGDGGYRTTLERLRKDGKL